MRGLAADQAAQRDDGVIFSALSQRARLRRNFKRARHAYNANIFFTAAAAAQPVERALQESLGDERVPAAHYYAKAHAVSAEITFNRVFAGTIFLPEKNFRSFSRFSHKKT